MYRFNPRLPAMAMLSLAASTHAQQATSFPPTEVIGAPIIESNNIDGYAGFSTRVTAWQVRDLGALDLAAALRMTPGVQISRYNEVGSYSGDQGGNVYIRGIGASRPGSEIKTYLDGIPLYMGVWNHPLIDLLPLQGITAIDVHKGPHNQASGNDLSSVHLISRRPSQDGVAGELNVSAGSFSTRTLQANLLGRTGAVDYSLAASNVQSDGARPNAQGKLTNAMGRIAFKLNPAWALGASFLAVNNQVGDPGDNRFAVSSVPIGPYSFSNGVGTNDSATHLLTAFASHQHGDWKGEVKFYANRGHNNLANDANWGSFDSRFKMSGWRWKEEFSPWEGGKLAAGIDQDTVSGSISGPFVGAAVGTPFGFGPPGTAVIPTFRVTSAYAGVVHSVVLPGGWLAQPSAGVRYYNSNIYPSRLAPNAGVTFISSNVTAYANVSRGILYPGAETYTLTRAIPMAFAANNGWDRLSPTQDNHREIGVKWDVSSATHVDFSLFQDAISKRYVWTGFFAGAIANPASGTWSNNFPDYRIRGAEASIRHDINRQWAFFGGVTALHASLSNLPYAPSVAFSAGLTGLVAGYRVTLDAQHQSRMYALTQDRGAFAPNRVGALSVANARISHPLLALGKEGEIYAAINNLFGASYQYNAGYPMPGRNFRIGMTASF